MTTLKQKRKQGASPFYRWLRAQTHRSDPVGQFARQAMADANWPTWLQGYEPIAKHWADRGAGTETLEQLERATDAYRREHESDDTDRRNEI